MLRKALTWTIHVLVLTVLVLTILASALQGGILVGALAWFAFLLLVLIYLTNLAITLREGNEK